MTELEILKTHIVEVLEGVQDVGLLDLVLKLLLADGLE